MRSICRVATIAACVALGACAPWGDNGVTTPEFGAPSPFFPAQMPHIPQIVDGGGPIMTGVHVVPVFFQDDPNQPGIEDFMTSFAASQYWPEMVAEYGVGGPLTIDPSVVVGAAPATGDDFVTLVQSTFGSASTDTLAQTIYAFAFQKQQILFTDFGTSCIDFAGFHTTVAQNAGSGSDVPQVIVALDWGCDSSNLALTDLDVETVVYSHEMVEAATDPFPTTGWGGVDAADAEWELHFGGEVGDMCEAFPRRVYDPPDLGFFIQRTWSNSEAAQFHDPCVPHVPDDPPFFAAIPDEPAVDNGVRAVNVPLGGSTTIEVQFLADGPTNADWIVEPIDESTLDGGPAALEFSLDRNSGENGELAHLTITPAPGALKGLQPYRLISTLGGIQNEWLGVVDLKATP